jgi:predicted nuclease of restriction endonuclease-like (RecB) superfamily
MKKRRLPTLSNRNTLSSGFANLLQDVKSRIGSAQTRAMLAANAELVRLYWDVGRLINERQEREGWGTAVIPRLAAELQNDLPELRGFSERNIKRMLTFHREYEDPAAIVPQAAALLPASKKVPQAAAQLPPINSLLWSLPWFHHVILIEKVKNRNERVWYMQQTLANGWSRNVLATMIDARAHERQGRAITNFDRLLPGPQSDLAQQALKDPYIFDFLTLAEPFHERELEAGLIRHLETFLLELGQGFAFVGRQYRFDVGGEDYSIDLLFYHLRLRAYLVIDLKTGKFKPEYAGKLNFYCNVINERLRHPDDQPTIGLILCQTKDNLLAEYSLTGIEKPIGVSSYELTRALPPRLQSALPTVEEIETQLAATESKAAETRRARKKTRKAAKAKVAKRRSKNYTGA